MAKWLSLLAALAATTHAALRFGCSTLTIQRLDPLVEPGRTPSSHLHQIVGGDAFNATMTGDIGEQGRCTTCTFSEDFSNYWTAVMFFRHQNGSYKRVPIMQNTALPNGINGGMTVYYTQQDFFSNGNVKMTAFKPVSCARPLFFSFVFLSFTRRWYQKLTETTQTQQRASVWSSATRAQRPCSRPVSSLCASKTRARASPSSTSSPHVPAREVS